MTEKGSCTDITCDDEIKELYHCHCCLRLVCLTHLIRHVEITKQNKQRLDSLRNELNTVINTLKLIVEEKLITIKREQNLIEQANKFLDAPNSSIDELQNIFEQINQTIVSNRSEEMILKVEPSLSETKYCSCVYKCNMEHMNSNAEELEISKDNRCSTYINHDFMDTNSSDETTKSVKDQHVNEEQKKLERTLWRKIFDECPLTFDGAYGLTQANHSIEFCDYEKNYRIGLYQHFINKHKLKEVYAQRLIRAVADNQDPRITKLFNESEDVIDHFYKVLCPFFKGRINSPEYRQKNIANIPCSRRIILFNALNHHLRFHHKISKTLAKKLVDHFKEIRAKNDIASTPIIPST
ncbi:unnamed protein product [Rotaria sordida]|uniref:Uncharacterized protein n=2 Tax=Rotaria sordida TaxID=392033 RepID=A0A814YA03_9BILA|nr:unnamed protein product [Rotaria sordida]CAF1232912.1 unnamed protein product [Rotaria sordida]CAF1507693.1 unnamed protein product [Rotaria sordida]CAF1514292.1 unnamed protein product [Rotaria sordida]CAF4128996.1 unnamed protein product [Rotaria sordida]